jgi:hypothetical protein
VVCDEIDNPKRKNNCSGLHKSEIFELETKVRVLRYLRIGAV